MEDILVKNSSVLSCIIGCVGRISLNKPQNLHALDTDMCQTISAALSAFAKSDQVKLIIIDHVEGSRGFCSGGDIKNIAQNLDNKAEVNGFFAAEYRLNAQIKAYIKPIVSFMDGLTMGGGVGLSVHGSHRLATENTVFAMPETGIGLFPDVGGGWFLPRLDGALGTWLALSGTRLNGSDTVGAGLATHYIESGDIAEIKQLLCSAPYGDQVAQQIDQILAAFAKPLSAPSYAEHMEIINRCFSKDTMADICIELKLDDSDWSLHQGQILAKRSPISCCITLKQLRLGAKMTSFDEVMRMEYRIVTRLIHHHDFYEGVRAALIDKDHKPHWHPTSFGCVNALVVETFFDALPQELTL